MIGLKLLRFVGSRRLVAGTRIAELLEEDFGLFGVEFRGPLMDRTIAERAMGQIDATQGRRTEK
jgi:hypothetical protein